MRSSDETKGASDDHLHKVALEEALQLLLGCRVGKVSDVQAATFRGTGKDSVIVGGLVVSLASDGGIGQSVSNVIDGVSNFVHDGRHCDILMTGWSCGWLSDVWLLM